jgi:hypothetical protein
MTKKGEYMHTFQHTLHKHTRSAAYIHTYMYIAGHSDTQYLHSCTCTHTCVHIYIYIHIGVYTYLHIYM